MWEEHIDAFICELLQDYLGKVRIERKRNTVISIYLHFIYVGIAFTYTKILFRVFISHKSVQNSLLSALFITAHLMHVQLYFVNFKTFCIIKFKVSWVEQKRNRYNSFYKKK